MGEERERQDIEKSNLENIAGLQQEHQNRNPPWSKQITARGDHLFASLELGAIYSVIVMNLNLTTSPVPCSSHPQCRLCQLLFYPILFNFLSTRRLAYSFHHFHRSREHRRADLRYRVAVLGGWLILIFIFLDTRRLRVIQLLLGNRG